MKLDDNENDDDNEVKLCSIMAHIHTALSNIYSECK